MSGNALAPSRATSSVSRPSSNGFAEQTEARTPANVPRDDGAKFVDRYDPMTAFPLDDYVGDQLVSAWQDRLLTPVASRVLPKAIDAIWQYHQKVGFFEERLVGMRRLNGYGDDGAIEVAMAPNRHKVPVRRSDDDSHCGLCRPEDPRERGVRWRQWNVWPNAFPYVPAKSQHLVLTHAEHRAQGFSPDVLGDMLDFQMHAAGGKHLTLHYNGTAGNSQFHLHWQATREHTPLERLIDGGKIAVDPVLRTGEGSVGTYDAGSFAGILVRGSRPFIVRLAARIVSHLERDPKTDGAYNMLLIGPRNGQQRLVIVPRRADNLRPVVGSAGRCGFGAFTASGIVVMPRAKIPADFGEHVSAAMRATVVPPSQLPWLRHLSRPQLRAAA